MRIEHNEMSAREFEDDVSVLQRAIENVGESFAGTPMTAASTSAIAAAIRGDLQRQLECGDICRVPEFTISISGRSVIINPLWR